MIIPWIVIIIAVLLVVCFMKLDHHAHILKTVIIIGIILLLGFSMYNMFKSKNIDYSSPKEIINTIYMYFGWLGNTVSELWQVGKDTVSTVGNVIKIEDSDIQVEKIDWNKTKDSWISSILDWIKNIVKSK